MTEGDYDRREATLHVRATKFYKSRLLPIHEGISDEIDKYLSIRAKRKLPSSPGTPLMWNTTRGRRAYTGTGISCCIKPLLHQCGIKAASGLTPRIHDFRHYAEFRTMPSKISEAPCFRQFPQTRLGIVRADSGHGCWSNGNSIRLLL